MIDIEFYFLFTIVAVILCAANKTLGLWFLVLFCSLFLLYLPTTGLDYDKYEDAFDNSYLVESFPWIESATDLTAEKGYIRYQGFFGVFLPYGFPSFLMLNFLLNVLLSFFIFKGFKLNNFVNYFWLYFLPVIFPTIFYFSPRSSISFFLCFFSIVMFSRKKFLIGIFLIYLGTAIHSQFIFQALLLIFSYLYIQYIKDNFENFKKKIYIASFVVFVLTLFLSTFSSLFVFFIKFLPSSDYALIKFEAYTSNARTGVRVASALSILVYPYMMYKLQEKYINSEETLFYPNKLMDNLLVKLLFSAVFFGAAINLGFYNQPHMAGRLSRLSEYIGFGLILPSYLYSFLGIKWVYILAFIFIILAPILFATIYINSDWNFNF